MMFRALRFLAIVGCGCGFFAQLPAANLFLDSRTAPSALGAKPDPARGSTPGLAAKGLNQLRIWPALPGDTLFLARGSRWIGDSLILTRSGEAGKPVVVMPYGDDSAAPWISNYGQLVTVWKAKHLVIRGLHLSGARAYGLGISDSADDVVVENLEVEDCGIGIGISGTHIVVRNNRIHDLHMIVNTPGAKGTPQSNDDYGAIGIGLAHASHSLVEGNELINCIGPSADYGTDGGAVEFWSWVHDCEIRNNRAFHTDGFIEMGGRNGDTVKNIRIHHNLAIETEGFSWFHAGDTANIFAMAFDNVHIEHNTVVTREKRVRLFVGTGGVLGKPDQVQVRNNLFVADSAAWMFYRGEQFVHGSNLLWTPKDLRTAGDRASGDLWGDPRFRDEAHGDYTLDSGSAAHAAGVDLGYASDFRGIPLPSGVGPDVGAFQSSVDYAPLDLTFKRFGQNVLLVGAEPYNGPVTVVANDLGGRNLGVWHLQLAAGAASFQLPRFRGSFVLHWERSARRGTSLFVQP